MRVGQLHASPHYVEDSTIQGEFLDLKLVGSPLPPIHRFFCFGLSDGGKMLICILSKQPVTNMIRVRVRG